MISVTIEESLEFSNDAINQGPSLFMKCLHENALRNN